VFTGLVRTSAGLSSEEHYAATEQLLCVVVPCIFSFTVAYRAQLRPMTPRQQQAGLLAFHHMNVVFCILLTIQEKLYEPFAILLQIEKATEGKERPKVTPLNAFM
jgi:hypothetical protein